MKQFSILTCTLLLVLFISAQEAALVTDDNTIENNGLLKKYVDRVSSRADKLNGLYDKKSGKILRQFEKQEKKMQARLARIDSSKARQLFGNIKDRYHRFENQLGKVKTIQEYIPNLDSLGTSLKFLQQNKGLLAKASQSGEKIKSAMAKVKGLEGNIQHAEEIKQFIRERRQFLKQQLQQLGLARQLKKMNKQAYYYGQQVAEYKEMLNDHKKIERKALQLLSRTKLFRDYMGKNSIAARLFPIPVAATSSPGGQAGFAGLQTRAQVTSFIQQSAMGSATAMPAIQRNIQDAQSQVTELRNRISQLTGGSSNDLEMPDFKPNLQKTKSFLKRLEYGVNLQSQKARLFFPSSSDIGLTIGYKLNDRSTIGIGASYKIGWGTGWKNIKITHQGLGIRSFIEWKIKGSFWLSGGYEQNYRAVFQRIEELRDLNAWQQSGLIGISKTISLKTKMFKKTKFQLLWDFMSYRQRPQTQPILFRLGYNF